MKTKIEYLDALENELKYLKSKVRKTIIQRYMEKINVELDFGVEESRIIEKMPNPNQIAISIYKEYGIDLEKKKSQVMSTYALISTIIGSILVLLILSFGIISYIYLFEMLLNFFSLYKELMQFNVIDAIISSLNFTVFLFLSAIAGLFIYELILYLIVEIIDKVIDTYPNIDKSKFHFLDHLSLTKIIQKKLIKIDKVFTKTIGVLILFFIVLSITSYVTKGYMYRVIMDSPQNNQEFVIDTSGLLTIKFEGNIDEVKWIFLKSDDNQMKIDYFFEFNRNFMFEFIENTLVLSIDPARKYDAFDLLKEPVHQIHIYIPEDLQIESISIKATHSTLTVEELNVDIIEYETNRGQLMVSSVNGSEVKVTLNQGALDLKNGTIDKLDITIDSASLHMDQFVFVDANIKNQFGKISLSKLIGNLLSFDNGGGRSTMIESNIDTMLYQSRNGTLSIQESSIVTLNTEMKATNQLDIYKGSYQNIQVSAEKGSLDIEEVEIQNDIVITGMEFFVSIINTNVTKINSQTTSGAIGIRDSYIHDEIKIIVNQGDVTIVSVETTSIDVFVTRGIVNLKNLYSDIVKIYMESGDLSYDNDDLSRVIGILDITTNQANRRINVGS